jgi:hypothetical protein
MASKKRGGVADGNGLREDAGKLPIDLIPADVQAELAEVLRFGARKYAARNWERGMAWSKAYGPLLRHLNEWARGHRIDKESGRATMAHVLCNAVFLLAYELRGLHKLDDVEPYLKPKPRRKR